MAIEAGRMVVSAGNIEWLNFDFTKAMPDKEKIVGVSSFSIGDNIEGHDELELDSSYGAGEDEFERFDLDTNRNLEYKTFAIYEGPGSDTLYYVRADDQGEPPTAAFLVRVGEYFDPDEEGPILYENDPSVFVVVDGEDPKRYKLVAPERDGQEDYRYREAAVIDVPYPYIYYRNRNDHQHPNRMMPARTAVKTNYGFFNEMAAYYDGAGSNRAAAEDALHNPENSVSLIEVFDDAKIYNPRRFKIFHAFQNMDEPTTTATDPTRKIVSIAAKGVAEVGPDGQPIRPDAELDSIWLVTCRIRTSPGGLTRSGSMLVVGSG